ncbi:hypothetical protein VKT23_012277 [Stygiomarasmius scandens]|uniref:Uncharacterized protein n=1 Tax=Marasmiellus scandens TaxID=2682957 RepID=A0ABR1J7I9_9AGAR
MNPKRVQDYGEMERNLHLSRSIPPSMQLGRMTRLDEESEVMEPLTTHDERPSKLRRSYSVSSLLSPSLLQPPQPATSNSSPFVSQNTPEENRIYAAGRPAQIGTPHLNIQCYPPNRTSIHSTSLYRNPSLAGSMILYRIAPPASFSTLASSATSTRPPLPVPSVERSLLHPRPIRPASISPSDDTNARFCSHILSQYAHVESRSSLPTISERSNSTMSMSLLSFDADSKYPMYPYTRSYAPVAMSKCSSSGSGSDSDSSTLVSSSEGILPPGLPRDVSPQANAQVQIQDQKQDSPTSPSFATGGIIAYIYNPDEDDPDADDEDDEEWAEDPLVSRVWRRGITTANTRCGGSFDSGIDMGPVDTCNVPKELASLYHGRGESRAR